MMKKLLRSCLYLPLLLFAAVTALGMPAIPTPTEVTQPDGTVLEVQIKGDERQNWIELHPSGHTVIKNDKTGYWEYAERSSDDSLKSSGVKAEPGGRNAPDFIRKELRPQRNQELENRLSVQATPMSAQQGERVPLSGTKKALIILVNFSNRTLITTPAGWYGALYDTTAGVKSMANFFSDNSFGAISVLPAPHTEPGNPPGVITTTVSATHPDYGGYINPWADSAIAAEALAQASAYIDFPSYDSDGNGVIDRTELAIYFVFAGYEAAGTTKRPSVWAHAYPDFPVVVAGKVVRQWALNGELNYRDVQHPVGVVVHEMGHAFLNLPDLYDTTYVNQAMGHFSTMAGGSWGMDVGEDGGATPTNLDVWCRQLLGWTVPVQPARGDIEVPAPLSSSTAGYKLIHDGVFQQEYFLVEGRQPVGWDRGLRGYLGADWKGGILVLHVDDAIDSNDYRGGSHQKVVPVQASTTYCDMLSLGSYCRGHATTLFYQGNNDAWFDTTTPDSKYYSSLASGFSLTSVSAPQSVMTARFHPDTVPPVITSFIIPATSTTLTVPVLTFLATDNTGVAGYLVNESAVPPAENDPSWSVAVPGSYTCSSGGTRTMYAWAKDAAGTVSASRSATVVISEGDTVPPTVTAFSVPATTSSLTVSITTFTATDNVGVTGYLVNENAAKPAASDPGWSATRPASYTFSTPGTKTLYAWAKDAAGNVSESRSAAVTVQALPVPWKSQDVGSVAVAGSTSYQGGIFTVTGAGADVWGSSDGFHFAYVTMTGDGAIVARVRSVQYTNGYAKGGVMMRQSLTANSAHAMVDITPSYGAEFSRRTTTGSSTTVTGIGGVAAPYWVKLVRSGNTFYGYISSNGADWRLMGSSTIAMGSTIYVGLLSSSHNVIATCTTTFDGVGIPTGDTEPPVVTAFTLPGTSTSLSVPITTLTATDNVGVTGYLVSESATRPSPTDTRWSSVKPESYTFATAGAKTLYAWAIDAALNVSASRSATTTVGGGDGLPAPWVTQDVGAVGLGGSVAYSNGVFTVRGAGADVWGNSDSFRYVYQPLTGDGQIVARITSLGNTNGYAKAGVMFRQSLDAGSVHAMMVLTPTYGAEFSRRTSSGGATTVTGLGGIAAPYWVKLVRSGNTFTGYVAASGGNWQLVGSSTIAMGSTVYVGLAVCSHDTRALTTSAIDNVAVGTEVAPTAVITSPTSGTTFTPPATIPITATATPGTGAQVKQVDFYADNTLIGTATASPYTVTWGNVPAGRYSVTAVVTDTMGNTGTSTAIIVNVSSFATDWLTGDVGSVGIPGNAAYANGIFTIRGSGADIWGTADSFRFVYKTLTGDGQITARVTTLMNTNGYAKAGVMMRESLTAGSRHAMVDITPSHGAEFSRRATTGGSTDVAGRSGVAAPYWVRLVRSGSTFSGYISSNGTTWTLVGTSTIPMNSTLYVGLIHTSHNNAVLGITTIDSVQ